nr:glycosyltransferase [Conexibacter arvalis]
MAALKRLKRAVAPAPVAGPPSVDGAYDRSPVDALLFEPASDAEATAWAALRAGVRAEGRPVVLHVTAPCDADTVVAAVDAGAAAAVFDSGEAERDAALLADVLEAERRRLDDAPLITVAVCNRNGARDLEECFSSLTAVEYPRFETLLLDDGSTDDSVAVGRRHGVEVVELGTVGLGGARNAAIEHARGEVIAFLDGDAMGEPQWLTRLWRLHDRLRPGAVGGPNLPVANPNWQERAIAGGPGTAMPIVRADGRCTHIAGCNLSVRTDVARATMFDPDIVYGDDLIFCYRILDAGHDLLLHPTAIIRHHRRRSFKAYVRQMRNYGRWADIVHEGYGNRLVDIPIELTVLERLDPRRPHPCFVGPQAEQRYSLAAAPLANGFPGKVLALTLALGVALAPLALLGRRGRAWALTVAAALLGQFAYVAARTPAQQEGASLPGRVANRLLTAATWYGGPFAVAVGRRMPPPDTAPAAPPAPATAEEPAAVD